MRGKRGRDVPGSNAQDLVFYLQASRPGFWITSIWFYLLPLARHPFWEEPGFWLGLFFVTFPLGILIYGCNDLVDTKTDRLNPRKGTFLFGPRGTDEQLRRLPRLIFAVQVLFLLVFTAWSGTRLLWWFAVLLLTTACYNWPRIGFKNHPFLDMLSQAAYLLVFDLAVVLTGIPAPPVATYIFGTLFAMHSHLLGQIMDVEPDRKAGRRTAAVVVGVVRAKYLVALLLLAEAALMIMAFGQPVLAAAFSGGALWFLLDAALVFGDRSYPIWLARWFLSGWNVVAVLSAWWIWSTGSLSK